MLLFTETRILQSLLSVSFPKNFENLRYLLEKI